jgi:hypothetical protein
MLVSYLDWIYNYWVDYSDQWAEVFEITMEDFNMIQAWIANIIDWKVIKLEQPKKSKNEIADDNEYLEKKNKSDLIIWEYSITDQLNLMRKILCTLSKNKELHAMDEFIHGILVSNWEDEWSSQ